MNKKENTHSIPDIEGLINEKLYVMQNGATMKEKKKARTEVIRLERMLRDIDNKIVNTKGYIKKEPPETTKEELYRLIDSVDSRDLDTESYRPISELDLSGGSPIPGETRFKFVERGWDKPKFEHRLVDRKV